MQTAEHKLQELLQQLFRADNADLDFGIYRIINYRRDQIQNFIDEKFPAIVNDALDVNSEAESTRQEMGGLAQQISQTLGDNVLDADGNLINDIYREAPLVRRYLETREQLGVPQSRYQRADTIFNHLYTFFSRYYEDGDFIPRRRYSQTERYAIPYNGEEIYLHWANREQYYVKSGDLFSTYRFKSLGITVTFDLHNVDIEKDNVQGTKRFFIPLSAETIYSPETAEISIPFEYRLLTDEEKQLYGTPKQQDKINDTAETEILERVSSDYEAYAALERRVDQITTLKKHLDIYARRNTTDFFIHKDLKQFLNRELDVYIKNEVIPLSDFILTNENLGWLETAKAVYDIASQIIGFLSQIEEFQKRLWLKKKFVLSTNYCITLDRVPEEFYPEITKNTAQREEWEHLFAIHEIDGNLVDSAYDEPLSVAFLKENPNLVLDTRHFDMAFKDSLLASFENLDNETDGLLIHGENFQALNLLGEKYRESVKTIYIDPPYNTKGSDFLYKDQYKHASWMSLMADRISLTREILLPDGLIFISIDDNEQHHLRMLMDEAFGRTFGRTNFIACLPTVMNLKGNNDEFGFAGTHEYTFAWSKSKEYAQIGEFILEDEELESWLIDDYGYYKKGAGLKSTGVNAPRNKRPNLYYPIFVNERNEITVTETENYKKILPITDGEGMSWRWEKQKVSAETYDIIVERTNSGINLYKKQRPSLGDLPTKKPKSLFYKPEYSSGNGTTVLKQIFGSKVFNNPKPVQLLKDLIFLSTKQNDIILDFFAGSGTTAHATINLNRQDNGKRKYILIDMGDHFDTVLKPRVMKVIYTEKWKDGKPVSRKSCFSQIIKYQRVESYEDALNNIEFTERENLLFEEHLLSYLLGNETCESPTFLNVTKLQNPFNYQLNIVDGLQTQAQPIDLPETFNYLIGISVQTRQCFYDDERHYLVYRGTVGQKNVVIIWRETKGWEEKDWERDYRFIEEHKLTEGASEVYVNTDSLLPEAKSLDPLFKKLMFS